ncbi:MAG: ribosome maturation factor, partial [Polymorphobacter sp.]
SEYALEVSSPGIDRPLTRLTDFAKWVGHEVRLKLEPEVDGRKRLHGTIAGVDDAQNVSFDMPTIGAVTVPFAAIAGAKLVLTNKLINATRPAEGELLDAGDADEIIESDESVANDNDTDPAANDED